MKMNIEEQRRFIIEQIGENGLNILKENNINVDSTITKILLMQKQRSNELEKKARSGSENDMMTSELVYKSGSIEDIYGKEFTRRLKNINLDDSKINSLYRIEQTISSVDEKLIEVREQPWVRRYFIMQDSTPETIPKKELLTLSELILITDDANSAFFRDHSILPEKAWNALCVAACCAQYTEARYANHFNERIEKFGWSKEQGLAFIKNECLLTERLKWGMHDNPAWTNETCDLK